MLESVARAAARKPHVLHFRVPINQEIAARGVFVLADTRFYNGRVAERGKPPRHVRPHCFGHFRRNDSGLRVRIHTFAVLVEGNFQPAALDVRHAVHQILLKQPRWQRRRSKPRFSRRYPEKENFLPRWKNARAQHIREDLAEPSAACKNKLPGRNPFALVRGDMLDAPGFSRIRRLRGAIGNAPPQGVLNHGGHGPPRQEHPALGFEDPLVNLFERDLRIPFLQGRAAVSHAKDARLAPRAGSRVPRAVRFEKRHALPAFREVPRCPRAKDSGTNHCHVVCFLHLGANPSRPNPIATCRFALHLKFARRLYTVCGKRRKTHNYPLGAVCICLRRTVILMNLDALARFDENASLALSWISLAFRGYLPQAPGKSIKVQWPPRIASDSIERFDCGWFGGVCES